jgi:hypothetical protein
VGLRQAAAEIGVSAPYLSLLETDQKGKNLDHMQGTLSRAAAYYEVLPAYFLVDSPQDYTRAFVAGLADTAPYGFPGRLRLVVKELHTRWGDAFSVEGIAAAVGTTPEVLQGYLDGTRTVTDSLALQLSELTGAPLDWLVPRATTAQEDSPEVQRVIKMAVASGVDPHELELMITLWLAAKRTRPSG